MKRSPRPPFVRTFARTATFVAAALGTACSSSAGAPTVAPHDDAGANDAPATEDAGSDTNVQPPVDAPVVPIDSGTDTELAPKETGPTNPDGCPAAAPVLADKCAGAIVCTYSDPCPARPKGSDTFAVECHLGKWAISGPTYEAPCPRDIPEEDGACLCGAHMPKACGYDICDVDGEPPLLAICDEKSATWLILVQECNPPPPGTDAGTDAADGADAGDSADAAD